jgi:hypothetical protein
MTAINIQTNIGTLFLILATAHERYALGKFLAKERAVLRLYQSREKKVESLAPIAWQLSGGINL